jgi:hypothetical protein
MGTRRGLSRFALPRCLGAGEVFNIMVVAVAVVSIGVILIVI